MTKSLEDYFADWETHVFGFGYGTGERHVLGSMKGFFDAMGDDGRPNSYDYEKLESALGGPVTWLLINIFGRNNIIEYGTSPRYAWLTKQGEALKAFIDSKTIDELVDIIHWDGHDYCWPEGCNCGPEGHKEGEYFCDNPFWKSRRRLPQPDKTP